MVAHESGTGGRVTGCRSCPEQSTDDEKDHADKSLTTVDYCATTKLVGRKGPH
jgi:hypothetical protein